MAKVTRRTTNRPSIRAMNRSTIRAITKDMTKTTRATAKATTRAMTRATCKAGIPRVSSGGTSRRGSSKDGKTRLKAGTSRRGMARDKAGTSYGMARTKPGTSRLGTSRLGTSRLGTTRTSSGMRRLGMPKTSSGTSRAGIPSTQLGDRMSMASGMRITLRATSRLMFLLTRVTIPTVLITALGTTLVSRSLTPHSMRQSSTVHGAHRKMLRQCQWNSLLLSAQSR
jgi:hypothetical protein